ncbi:hypothetical protein SAMN04487897_11443 [Paenibacillus sp. yr247]|uniref:hypothetical protein n=1 Tax=Paenibacillus sp. yr247 TaxID=1761880 RepID=UPI0008857A8D|nr:hypothetical protein [Paenibacillus sp. yr247]SDO43423.1 hypothetical protein SAMN04487897_11443 [Paenibacillus sp. yr247]
MKKVKKFIQSKGIEILKKRYPRDAVFLLRLKGLDSFNDNPILSLVSKVLLTQVETCGKINYKLALLEVIR